MSEIREVIYVGDPMCSWCWGIAPEIDKLMARHPEISLRVVTGGLRPGPSAEILTDDLAGFLTEEWEKIHAYTGQPFDLSILGRRGWLYDTEPACRAVACLRELDEPAAWRLFKVIQRAFYSEGILVTEADEYPELVARAGGDVEVFMKLFESDAGRLVVQEDFATARGWGIHSFPTVLFREGDTAEMIASGYSTADRMDRTIQAHTAEGLY